MTLRAIVLLSLVLVSCGSTRGELWSDSRPGRLEDAAIVMTTTWETGGAPSVETRSAIVVGGDVTVSVDGPSGRREGTATADEWSALWSALKAVAPYGQTPVKPSDRDPKAGPYHHVSQRVGRYYNEWSAQTGSGFLGIETQRSVDRIRMSNAIYDFVESHATREVRKGPAPKPAPAKTKP